MTTRDYSPIASDNATISKIDLSDSMLADALDNAIRQLMADSANFLLDMAKATASTGSTNAYILSTGGTVSTYEDKVRLVFRASFSNTAACTINVDTLGVVDLKIYGASGVADPASGQIQSGGVYDIIYISELGDFVVLNPSSAGSIANVVDDTTPQLGGPLDANSHQINMAKGANIVSASALTPLDDGNYFYVSGTTTIASIATLGTGTVIRLQFGGVLTLTHSSVLVLPGAADITIAIGDVAEFSETGVGVWRMTSFNGTSSTADWEAGTSTKPSLASPANVKAAVEARGISLGVSSSGNSITSSGSITGILYAVDWKLISCYLTCTTSEHGFAIGAKVPVYANSGIDAAGANKGFNIRYYLSQYSVYFGSSASVFSAVNYSNAVVALTNSSWEFTLDVYT